MFAILRGAERLGRGWWFSILLGSSAAAQSARALEPVRVAPVQDLAGFRAQAARFDAEALPVGASLGASTLLSGFALEFPAESSGSVWLDTRPRQGDMLGEHALRNFGAAGGRARAAAAPADAEPWSLRIAFTTPVTRAAFQLRCVREERANLVLTAWQGTERLGRSFFDVDHDFRVVGLQSARPFGELRLAFTNPDQVQFSLDELVHDLDLSDRDRDGVYDFVDLCPDRRDTRQVDSDGDGRGDACDPFPLDALDDEDGDGLGADVDRCPTVFDPEQLDTDGDGLGNACDPVPFGPDQDGDGIPDGIDNCPITPNPDQDDCDGDGVGDLCDSSRIRPANVHLALSRGQSITFTTRICVPSSPPRVDFLLAVDTTGSMGGEIQRIKEHIINFGLEIRRRIPESDVRFGLVTYDDYPRHYVSCGYSNTYGGASDRPFEVRAPIGTPDEDVLAAIQPIIAAGGADGPESYTRVLWELKQLDSGIGFRPGARRVVLNTCDDIPHDCFVSGGIACSIGTTTGIDPGRDEQVLTADDIDLQDDALIGLRSSGVRLFTLFTGASNLFCAWEEWCERTGGAAVLGDSSGVLPPGTDLAGLVLDLISEPVVEEVQIVPTAGCTLQFAFDPPISGPIDVTHGAEVVVQQTVTLPADLPPDVHTVECTLIVAADDVLLGFQQVRVDVDCTSVTFEGLPNGQELAPDAFASMGVTLSSTGSNRGPTVFDTTPGGPNDPAINTDMLISRGNVLLLQDDAHASQSVPGTFDVVTDDPDGGDLVLDFDGPVAPLSLLLADINPPPNQGASVTLVDEAGRTRVYAIEPGWTGTYGNAGPHRLDLTTLAPQPGNGTTRFATASESPGFDGARVLRMVVHLTGFGAIDELIYCR